MTWRCWTRGCQEHYNTDIFGFVKGVLSKNKEANFADALKYICRTYKINTSSKGIEEKTQQNPNNEFSSFVKIFANKTIKDSQANLENIVTCGKSEYFISRNFHQDTLERFGVEDCVEKNEPMRYRAIIPVHCDEGKKIGFIARSIKDYITPKYLFSKNFKKSDYLYNYHRAIKKSQQLSCIFVVEGQGDVWRLYEAGVYNCVGLFGKDISQQQKTKLIRSGVTSLVILTDNDQAGREAKIKIQRDLNRTFNLKFPRMLKKDIGDMSIKQIEEEILPQVKGLY
jgi:DNA primase